MNWSDASGPLVVTDGMTWCLVGILVVACLILLLTPWLLKND